jgi:hypothetical protein
VVLTNGRISASPSPGASSGPSIANTSRAAAVLKQESELMEDLRHIEEQEALEKWERIVQFCREVKSQLHYVYLHLNILPYILHSY